jgi:dTDP-glucose 4,6-dehydratase
VEANTLGTAAMLEDARRQGVKAFITVSTDEVYGQILEGAYSEDAPLCPRNPYAASKAGADALTISYKYTFGMWTAVTRTENNYGLYQHPQKALPVFIGHAMRDEKLPVYGDGGHVRQWLYVDDHVRALLMLLDKRESLPGGEVWHIAGNQEITNNELAKTILRLSGKPETNIRHIDDFNIRPGHDRRYALTCDKMHNLGWHSTVSLEEGLKKCVEWYCDNPTWLG